MIYEICKIYIPGKYQALYQEKCATLKKTFSSFVKRLYDFPNGSLLEHFLIQNPMISPTAHKVKGR